MITALAIMIAIAGYLQFAGTNLEKEYLASDNTEDLSAVDSTDIVTDMESLDSDVEIVMEDYLDEDMQVAEATPDEGEIPGEAVLTGTNGVEVLSAARLSKEQTRARNKETLLEIINSTELSDAQKQEAVDSMVRMTDIAEKEAAAEVLLQAKGFSEAVVSINGGCRGCGGQCRRTDGCAAGTDRRYRKKKDGYCGGKYRHQHHCTVIFLCT